MAAFAPSARSQAQPKDEREAGTSSGTEALQKATQNPVASLISVPAQNNSNFGVSPGDRTQDLLNIQPVIPVGKGSSVVFQTRFEMRVGLPPADYHVHIFGL